MKTDDLIKVYNVLTEDECKDIIDWFWEEEDRHVDGAVYGRPADVRQNHVLKDFKDTRQIYPKPDDRVSDLLSRAYFEVYDRYAEECPVPPEDYPLVFRDYCVRIYHKGKGFFSKHQDQGPGVNVHRVFGIVGYLNDVEEGGGTYFHLQDRTIPARRGDVCIFPCNYLWPHEGTVPISDSKYAITSFISYANND